MSLTLYTYYLFIIKKTKNREAATVKFKDL